MLLLLAGLGKMPEPRPENGAASGPLHSHVNFLRWQEHPAANDVLTTEGGYLGGPVVEAPANPGAEPAPWPQYVALDVISHVKYGVATAETATELGGMAAVEATSIAGSNLAAASGAEKERVDGGWTASAAPANAINRFHELERDTETDYARLDQGGHIQGTPEVLRGSGPLRITRAPRLVSPDEAAAAPVGVATAAAEAAAAAAENTAEESEHGVALGALRAAIGITALASDLQSGRRKLRDPEAHAAFGHAAVSEGAAADGDAPGVAGEESEEVRMRCGPNVGRDLPCGRSRRRSLLFD